MISGIRIRIQHNVVAVDGSTHVIYDDSQCAISPTDRHCSHLRIVTINEKDMRIRRDVIQSCARRSDPPGYKWYVYLSNHRRPSVAGVDPGLNESRAPH